MWILAYRQPRNNTECLHLKIAQNGKTHRQGSFYQRPTYTTRGYNAFKVWQLCASLEAAEPMANAAVSICQRALSTVVLFGSLGLVYRFNITTSTTLQAQLPRRALAPSTFSLPILCCHFSVSNCILLCFSFTLFRQLVSFYQFMHLTPSLCTSRLLPRLLVLIP